MRTCQKFTLIKKTVNSKPNSILTNKLVEQLLSMTVYNFTDFLLKIYESEILKFPHCVGCISWRQTRGCDGKNGRRHPRYDRGCDEYIRAGRSGFCECENGPTAYKNCNASPFRTCTDACNAGSG